MELVSVVSKWGKGRQPRTSLVLKFEPRLLSGTLASCAHATDLCSFSGRCGAQNRKLMAGMKLGPRFRKIRNLKWGPPSLEPCPSEKAEG